MFVCGVNASLIIVYSVLPLQREQHFCPGFYGEKNGNKVFTRKASLAVDWGGVRAPTRIRVYHK